MPPVGTKRTARPVWRCLLFKVTRKSGFGAVRAAFDPEADLAANTANRDLVAE